jgi:hypothetical protein
MTEQKLPADDAGGTTAAERAIPEQVVREPGTTPEIVRPAVPEQATAPAEEAVAPLQAEAPEEAAVEARPHRRLRRRKPRRQSAFRRWRKTRPFWGGLFTMLAGLEIALLTAASYELLFVSKSVGVAITVGGTIAIFGLTMWLSPALSKLLGLLTLLAALLSFVTSNLGGFLLGMLLAILGGGLCFAWEPGKPEVADRPAPTEPETDAPVEDRAAAVPGQRQPATTEEFAPLDRLLDG